MKNNEFDLLPTDYRYEIIRSCLLELVKRGIVQPKVDVQSYREYYQLLVDADSNVDDGAALDKIDESIGLSMRTSPRPASPSQASPYKRSSHPLSIDASQSVEDMLYRVAELSEVSN
jgi:hypothetical protein